MVVEVQAPKGGIFHPKLWLLRYTAEDRPPLYRLLNLSRNLTFDRSWDVMLNLEGEAVDRQVGFSRNRPLSHFLQALPGLALHPVSQPVADRIAQLQDEVRRVDFQNPPEFDGALAFHPFGIPGYRSFRFDQPFYRMLVVSPFLTNKFLADLTSQGRGHTLISRLESLDELLEDTRQRFEQVYLLDEMAEHDPQEASPTAEPAAETESTLVASAASELSGLHAKLFIWEYGWEAGWLIGSANATGAAFHTNVEFMIELHGKKSQVGIETVLGEANNRNALRNLLQEYTPSERKAPADRNQKRAEELAHKVSAWLANSGLSLSVQQEGEQYDLTLQQSAPQSAPDGEYTLACWPVSLPEIHRQAFSIDQAGAVVCFKSVSLASLTTFMAFELSVLVGKTQHIARFVLNLPINGLPPERDSAVLCAVLSDRAQFLRYLRLLLMEDATLAASGGWSLGSQVHGRSEAGWSEPEMPLLEELIRALSRSNDPNGKIARINDLIQRLRRTPEGQEIIPPEFDALWQMIQQAQQELQ